MAGMTDFTINIQAHVGKAMREIHSAIEDGCDDMLRAAYDAGYDAGSDDEAYNARGIGPHDDRPPSYEEWRDAYIEQHRGI